LAARSPESRLAMNTFAAVQLWADLQLGSKQMKKKREVYL
jgi:hypothetical protein